MSRSPHQPKTTNPRATARLQPSLLDRLTDNEPHSDVESANRRAMSRAELRQSVLRDLAWLLNTANGETDQTLHQYPHAIRSVVNFGMRPLSGLRVSEIDWTVLEQNMCRAILDFEPRILKDTLQVSALATDDLINHHNMLAFQIRCQLWAQPYPLELLLRTNLDLESGEMLVQDQSVSGT